MCPSKAIFSYEGYGMHAGDNLSLFATMPAVEIHVNKSIATCIFHRPSEGGISLWILICNHISGVWSHLNVQSKQVKSNHFQQVSWFCREKWMWVILWSTSFCCVSQAQNSALLTFVIKRGKKTYHMLSLNELIRLVLTTQEHAWLESRQVTGIVTYWLSRFL